VAETTVKRLLCCWFRGIGKAMGKVNQYWWSTCREINTFPRLEYNMFYVLYQFVTYLLAPPRILESLEFCLVPSSKYARSIRLSYSLYILQSLERYIMA
jgi:hypothetical protein